MKQLNVRLTPGLYEAVQSLLQERLNMDVSTFVRELFIDALVIYASYDVVIEVLGEMGQGHRIQQGPGVVLAMAEHWREVQEKRRQAQGENDKRWMSIPAEEREMMLRVEERMRKEIKEMKAAGLWPQVMEKGMKRRPDSAKSERKLKGEKARALKDSTVKSRE